MDSATNNQRENEQRVAEEYLSSLSDLNCNSKPLINMLTMLAEENIEYAPVIVKVVEQHIAKVASEFKLPILYLIDSIVKNVKSTYVQLFSQCIVNIFCGAFEKVNEKIRERMYALRQTWNEVFSAQRLYALDVKVKRLDHNWPITAKQPSIHVNPNFLKANSAQAIPTEMEKILQDKTRELLELKKRKLELELEATKKHLEEQEKQFSKTAEGVIPPVEAIVAANSLQNVGIRGPAVAPQMMPGIIPSGYMGGPTSIAVNPAMRPAMFHHNMRGFRPNIHPNMMNNPPQTMSAQNMMSGGVAGANANKPKVHPVNSALLNSVRQRDPRLQRQQQQQQLQQQQQQQMLQNQNGERSIGQQQNSRSLHSDKEKQDRHHKSSRKSPTRMTSSSRSSGSSRSSKSSQRDKDRERDRERKRSESKSSTTSSSSSSSNTTNTERKKGFTKSSSENKQTSSKCDKDAFEIAPLSTAFKRKSASPTSSPSKSRDSKRSNTHKSRHSSRSKTRSRSRSPDSKNLTSRTPYGDVDLRRNSTTSTSSSMINSPEKRPKISDSDQEPNSGSSNNNKEDLTKTSVTASNATSANTSNKDLDKKNLLSSSSSSSAAASTTATSTIASVTGATTTISSSNRLNVETLKDTEAIKKKNESGQVSKDVEEDGKKRPLAPVKDEEPVAKKSKSAKIDALFGSEDVDLRQLIPPPMLTGSTLPPDDVAPPPPSINISSSPVNRESNENWDNLKAESNKNVINKAKSSLEDVRAKLAKTAKLNKLSKLDKLTRDIDHRSKLAELQMNDDTQEANDEKIRTMITQAQELLENNSISQDQYKHLVKTVMSINETNKLKEAKRRESLNAIKQKPNNDEGSNDSSERNLAMQAVLKKRIPKLNKTQTQANEQNSTADSQQSEGSAVGNFDDSPRVEEKTDSNDEATLQASTRANRGQREKRGPKVSKWGDRVIEPPGINMPMGGGQVGPQRPWNPAMVPSKRGMPPFRGNAPNVRTPWPMGGNGPPFGKGPMGPIRGNMPPIGPPQAPVIPKPCNSIDNPQEDLVRTITIDGAAKEIRFYDQVAIVFMEVDQPREIGFQNGQRSICIDNNEPIVLHFNDGYKSVQIEGETFNLRFGFPSRELYIDEHWYEIYFGGPPISVPIRNKMHMLKAEGPPPQVNIGPLRRDLVVGKINMIVDAHNVIPLFLDARMQTFKLGENEHTIQFADNLLTVLLDGTPTRVEYGGLPKSLFLGGKKYFVRFGALPQGVVAGKVQIKDMIYVETKPPNKEEVVTIDLDPVSPAPTSAEINPVELQKTPAPPSVPILSASALSNFNIDELFQKLVSTGILGGASGILPAVTNVAPIIAPTVAATEKKTTEGDNADNAITVTSSESNSTEEVAPPPPSVHMEPIKPIDLSKPESIKTRQAAIVETLFSGMQCSSCGVRFPPEQTIKYSQHLDWHFRQNRRERDSSRKAHARKWYYDLNDWVQYEEIEDLEEREKNFFETQQNDPEIMDETSNQRSTNSPIPTCPAGADDVDRACDMCQEKFEQFYDNELEEWHLRCAIRIEDKIYHPLCYEDYKASLIPPSKPNEAEEEETVATKNNEESLIQIEDDNAVDIVIKVEEEDKDDKKTSTISNTLDDDDDDVIVLPNEEPLVTEIVDDDDDDEYVPANVTREHMGHVGDEDEGQVEGGELNETTESDVEIQEPHIPFTDLDTYVEKELPEGDDASQMSFLNVKIKEEPKEDEDEDDGFEDVGTVVEAPEEISINSSDDTQTQTIESSNPALSPIPERPPSTVSSVQHNEDIESLMEPPSTDLNISMDGNIETGDEHNLSAAGAVPTVPLASLVNKIKINITKNTVTTSSNTSSSNNATTSTTMSSNSINHTDSLGSVSNPIPTISTIPVLCGGGTTISSISSSLTGGSAGGEYDERMVTDELGDNSVSTISVIGSYGSSAPTITHINRSLKPAVVPIPAPKPVTPPPVEETITYELKPALQKANLKKKEKVICGNETSGLCSIM
ncbi:pcf11 cleavage and polyadenylation factor subunit isoform 2-T2 [Cochliomyia hominivorax]